MLYLLWVSLARLRGSRGILVRWRGVLNHWGLLIVPAWSTRWFVKIHGFAEFRYLTFSPQKRQIFFFLSLPKSLTNTFSNHTIGVLHIKRTSEAPKYIYNYNVYKVNWCEEKTSVYDFQKKITRKIFNNCEAWRP